MAQMIFRKGDKFEILEICCAEISMKMKVFPRERRRSRTIKKFVHPTRGFVALPERIQESIYDLMVDRPGWTKTRLQVEGRVSWCYMFEAEDAGIIDELQFMFDSFVWKSGDFFLDVYNGFTGKITRDVFIAKCQNKQIAGTLYDHFAADRDEEKANSAVAESCSLSDEYDLPEKLTNRITRLLKKEHNLVLTEENVAKMQNVLGEKPLLLHGDFSLLHKDADIANIIAPMAEFIAYELFLAADDEGNLPQIEDVVSLAADQWIRQRDQIKKDEAKVELALKHLMRALARSSSGATTDGSGEDALATAVKVVKAATTVYKTANKVRHLKHLKHAPKIIGCNLV